ncbi:uncharacterized protein BXZ73DRAFT_107573 [Epithele typhae]|uniref:uncharacterized protein n=1 Tax=Epithele typhae TaxID=378194 RepID=UPI002007B1A9|nr:uncharacterized protein BXZ73DRAFT_107573 [Epithele typhae]KAH9912204.1 hypothetical protein BXZ73DRAFT_107573 [Epithele typhae]
MEEIPAETFLRRLMPGEDLPMDITDLYHPSEGSIRNMKSRRRVNVEIAKIARSVFLAEARTRCSAKPRMLLLDTSTRFLEDDSLGAGGHQRTHPDLSIYFNTERTHELLAANPPDESDACDELGDSSQTPTRAETMKEFIGATSYADIVVPIQVKTSHDHAAFRFQSHTGGVARRYSEKGCQSLEQITEYCSAILGRQHRTHLYAVYIRRDKARLLFVDRERCYVSEQFVYGTREDQTLHRFFWRLARMDRQQLGFDPSVILADREDEKRLLAHARGMKTADPQRALLLRALCRDPKTETHESVYTQWPLQRMTVGSETYVVGRPIIQTCALYGPAPRVFHAFRIEQDGSIRAYTFKDYWRLDHEKMVLEHKVYDRLKEAQVANIPTCVYGGDVVVDSEVQRTENGSLVHYRIVLENMLEPLLEFENFRELSGFMLNAMTAHEQAWCGKAKTLHRQIGTNSILILSEFDDATQQITRTALLGDWELSKTKTQMDNATGPRQRAVVGPWYFRSSLSLKYPIYRPYRLSDEVEAFVHVFQYLVLRFHVTEYTASQKESYTRLQAIVNMVYADFHIGQDNLYRGGDQKFIRMAHQQPWLDPMNNETMYDILMRIAKISSKHYSTINGRACNNRYGGGGGPSDQPVAAPDDFEEEEEEEEELLNEDGPLSTHKALKEIFQHYADIQHWDEKDATYKDDDFFWAAGIVPLDENGLVIYGPLARSDSSGSEPARKKHKM